MYPISNLDWSVVGMLDSLAARLAVQNRTFEAGSLDLGNLAISLFHKQGRDEQAEVIDGMEADEIQHVRYGNEWLRRLTDAQPRAVLEIAQAMAWLQKVVDATQRATSKDIPPDDHARQLAGFSSTEVTEVVRLHKAVLDRSTEPGSPRDD